MSRSLLVGAVAALSLTTAAQAASVAVVTNTVSLSGGVGSIGFHDPGTLDQTSKLDTQFVAKGLAYGSGGFFISGTKPGGVLGGNFLQRLNTSGDVTDQEWGMSFVEWGQLAYGDNTLFAGTLSFGLPGQNRVVFMNNDLSLKGVSIDIDETITGLAYGADSIFVGHGTTIGRYAMDGSIIDSWNYQTPKIGPLAFGGGKLFAAYDNGITTGWASINPDLLWSSGGVSVQTDDPIYGLTYGDGKIFASTSFDLMRYDATTGDYEGGTSALFSGYTALAYVGNGAECAPGVRTCDGGGGAVPEPTGWALMITGFAAAGASLRRRRAAFSA